MPDDRARIVADEHRSSICLPNVRVRPTFLVDGFAAGPWKTERAKHAARLVREPFDGLAKRARDELTKEGDALLRFGESDASSYEVRVG